MKDVRVLNGYRLLYRPDHPSSMTSKNWLGYVYEHIYISELQLGRSLAEDEVVHHLDCNRQNNRKENLLVMSRESHSKLHMWIDSGALVHESYQMNGMNSGKSKVHEPKFCEVCKSCLQDKQRYTCSEECNSLRKRKVPRPSYDELLSDMESMSFILVGKKYGVSDNAVRKWLRKYGYYDNPEPS